LREFAVHHDKQHQLGQSSGDFRGDDMLKLIFQNCGLKFPQLFL